jgi:hypothetical protein
MRLSLSRLSRPAQRALPLLAASAAVCASILCLPRTAEAQVYVYGPPPPPPPPPRYYYYDYRERPYAFMVGVDFEGAIPVNVPQLDGNNLTGGGGFKVRVGERILLQRGLHITPEVGYGYEHLFASDDEGNAYDWDLHRVFVGARLDFGHFVVPVIYGHVGYGWQDTGDPNAQGNGGFSYDVGGAIDFRFVPHLSFGAHIEYAAIDIQPDQAAWLALGVHGDVTF